MKTLPASLSSPRLHFRPPKLSDAQGLYDAYTSDPEVTRFVTWKPHQSVDESKEFLSFCLRRWHEGVEFNYVITSLKTGKIVGMVKVVPHDDSANLGYVFARKCWGYGYATETVKTFIAQLFDLGIEKVQAFCDIENAASARVMEKSGMKYQKILPKYMLHPNISSQKRDCRLYEIVKK